MLGRVAVFAVVLSALGVVVPQVAPGLLSIALRPGSDTAAGRATPAATPIVQAPPAAASRDDFRRVALSANAEGHYVAEATIDGREVTVMVDTGATLVALSDATAERLGIHPSRSAYTERVATANGATTAARVTLDEVSVGSVTLRHVDAVIMPGSALPVDLLGMSFLSRLSKFEIADGQLVLSQ